MLTSLQRLFFAPDPESSAVTYHTRTIFLVCPQCRVQFEQFQDHKAPTTRPEIRTALYPCPECLGQARMRRNP